MSGMTDYWARKQLDQSTGKTTITLPTVYIGLYTAAPTDAGGGTECTGNGYARVATAGADWNAASGSAPAVDSNANPITFPAATGGGAGFGTVVAIGAFDASTAGNLLWWDYLGSFDWRPFSCSSASPGVITSPAHGYSNGDLVYVTAEYGGTLPTTGGSWTGPLTVAGVTTDTFTAGVNTTGTGSGMVRKVSTQAVPSGITASFAASALALSQA